MAANPFSPGVFHSEQVLFGRKRQLQEVARIVEQIENNYPQGPVCFVAPSGLGKTSMLKHIARDLNARNWLCGYSEAGSSVGTAIYDVLVDAQRMAPRKSAAYRAISQIKGFNITAGPISIGLDTQSVDNGTAYARLTELFQTINDSAKFGLVGAALLIDEVQVLPDDHFEDLFKAVSYLSDSSIVLFMTALPNLMDELNFGIKSRPHIHLSGLAPLNRDDASAMLVETAMPAGGEFEENALTLLVDFARGHPLALQMLGHFAWNLSVADGSIGSRFVIRQSDADEAIKQVCQQFIRSNYRPTWKKCSPQERRVLKGLVDAGGRVTGREIERMVTDKKTDPFEVLDSLLGRGILLEDDEDSVTIVVPGFSEFIESA